MTQKRGKTFWAMVGFWIVAGTLYARFRPEGREEDRAVLLAQFHLPADVQFLGFRSGDSKGAGEIEGTVQFTDAQYAAYLATLDDPAIWRFTPVQFSGMETTVPPAEGVTRWYPASGAIIEGTNVASWTGWGFSHEKLGVWEPMNHRSFCFGVEIDKRKQVERVDRCTNFPRFDGPGGYVRGMIDEDRKRLYMYIRG